MHVGAPVRVLRPQIYARRAAGIIQAWFRGSKPLQKYRRWRRRRLLVKHAAFTEWRNWYVSKRHFVNHVTRAFFSAWKAEVEETRTVRCGHSALWLVARRQAAWGRVAVSRSSVWCAMAVDFFGGPVVCVTAAAAHSPAPNGAMVSPSLILPHLLYTCK